LGVEGACFRGITRSTHVTTAHLLALNAISDSYEIAHAHGLGYTDYGRERCEVLVDCVTYIVCSSVGLDVGGESIPYIAGWGEDGALKAIREYAETIDTIAHRIEDALAPAPESASDTVAADAIAA